MIVSKEEVSERMAGCNDARHNSVTELRQTAPESPAKVVAEENFSRSDYGDAEDSQTSECGKLILEQDRFLPIANISRLMKNVIPSTGKVAKDAKECVQECVSEFISFLTSEASERCIQEKRKTITGEDLLAAMCHLGFENYVEPLTTYIKKYREANRSDRGTESFSGDATAAPHHVQNAEENTSRSHAPLSSNVISLQSVSVPLGGDCNSQVILTGEDNADSSLRVLTAGNVQHLQLLMDPSTGQHYINLQTGNGTQQLLPVQVPSVSGVGSLTLGMEAGGPSCVEAESGKQSGDGRGTVSVEPHYAVLSNKVPARDVHLLTNADAHFQPLHRISSSHRYADSSHQASLEVVQGHLQEHRANEQQQHEPTHQYQNISQSSNLSSQYSQNLTINNHYLSRKRLHDDSQVEYLHFE